MFYIPQTETNQPKLENILHYFNKHLEVRKYSTMFTP